MTAFPTEEMCRLVVCGPDRRAEVAVPASVVVADLLPVLLHNLGADLADGGLAHGGWVLQRLGAKPFDEDSTVAALGLHDGETVHLRPRSEQLPEMDFDDLIDGVATSMSRRAGRWRPEMTGWAVRAVVAVLLGVALTAVALPGPAVPRAAAALGAGAVLLLAAVLVPRSVLDKELAPVFGVAAVGFAALGGLTLPGGTGPLVPAALTGDQVLAGTATAAATAVLAALLRGARSAVFLALTAGLLCGVAGSAAGMLGGLSGAQSAAVTVVTATVVTAMVPMAAFRLSGLRLAPLPVRPEHLQEDLDPEPAADLVSRTRAADRLMTAIYAGIGGASVAGVALLATRPGWAPLTLLGLVALVQALSARPMTSGWHRLALLLPATAALTAAAISLLRSATPGVRLLLLPLLLAVVAVPVALAHSMRERRLMPYWGRVGDVVLTLAAVAILPVLLAVLDAYGFFRAIGG